MMERKEAVAAGVHSYFTGRECSNGHLAHRYTSSGACVGCIKGYSKKYRAAEIRKNATGVSVYTHQQVHRDDFAAVDAYIMALNMQRQAARNAELDADVSARLGRISPSADPFKPANVEGSFAPHVPPPRLTAEERAYTGLPLHTKGLL